MLSQPVLTRSRTFVNAGCGPRGGGRVSPHFRDWREIRVDIEPANTPDVIASITDMSEVSAGIADAVWSSHCLEHLFFHEVPAALGEFLRVLNPDGFLCVMVPDLQAAARIIAQDKLTEVLYESPAGPVTSHDMVYGFSPSIARGDIHMAHRCGFTPTVLAKAIMDAGFAEVTIRRRPTTLELAAVALKEPVADANQRAALLADLEL